MVQTSRLIEYFSAIGVTGMLVIGIIWLQRKISEVEKDNKEHKNVLLIISERTEAIYKTLPNIINNIKQLSSQINVTEEDASDIMDEIGYIMEHEEVIRQSIVELQKISKGSDNNIDKELPYKFEYSEPEPAPPPVTYKQRRKQRNSQPVYENRAKQRNRRHVDFIEPDSMDQENIRNEEADILSMRNRRRVNQGGY